MGDRTRIEWTDATWNPVTGCTKASEGCRNCYAEKMAARLHAMGSPGYANGFKVTTHPEALGIPARWKKPRRVFVCSMGDLLHKDVPDAFVERVFDVMRENPRHTFQVLTKRAEYFAGRWPDNVWAGVTVEHADTKWRVEYLRDHDARVRFVSFEPLIGSVGTLDLTGIHWAIVGGESGPAARPMHPAWVREIRDQCVAARVPLFFKSWGCCDKVACLDGRTWKEFPR